MSKIIISILTIATALLVMSNSSCSRYKDPKQQMPQQDSAKASTDERMISEGYVKATVTDNTGLDGCRFMLTLESGKKLEPVNLEEKYMKDGMKVWVKYQSVKDMMSICMAGEMVRITAIEERK